MKSFKYKGWLCDWDEEAQEFKLYTPDELEQPKGFRYPEFEASTKEFCKELIDNY